MRILYGSLNWRDIAMMVAGIVRSHNLEYTIQTIDESIKWDDFQGNTVYVSIDGDPSWFEGEFGSFEARVLYYVGDSDKFTQTEYTDLNSMLQDIKEGLDDSHNDYVESLPINLFRKPKKYITVDMSKWVEDE